MHAELFEIKKRKLAKQKCAEGANKTHKRFQHELEIQYIRV